MSTVADSRFDPAATPAPLIVSAAGDLVDAETLRGLLRPALQTAGAVTVDLSAVTHLSMEAVVPLLALVGRCAAKQRLLLVIVSGPVRRKLTLLGLGTTVPLEPATDSD